MLFLIPIFSGRWQNSRLKPCQVKIYILVIVGVIVPVGTQKAVSKYFAHFLAFHAYRPKFSARFSHAPALIKAMASRGLAHGYREAFPKAA